MEYVYAALLLHAAGKEITEENLKAVLEAAGVTPDEARIKALVAALEGVNIDEVIEKAAMPVAAPVAVAAAPAAEGGAAEAAQEEEEEEEEEASEEEALAGLGALFG
ncbi:LSU ribosomal protein L12A [Thermococcus kodakarensis KOD1]|uniref:Large ribosomal subunit protein P1 n=1 Tax=Thermococcus kodakarensis (strain ATCC BAA-918 / JCM 12380 / KOD1) TaxID=69014 RepID=Q5JH09_THEKO|nr:50S ribosomal protein P1 [Thermococcus kodakarensis]WCN27388.1 50S ribosomal protein P1 [Thermococcus kodakarensis]WCN29678.1 50S ribosomal protein P1 [Thermococcus kodakarensis]BAD85604.1 LSU ribosomal protein L12A [Thermococcus kodakarensis KOD1]